MLEVLESLRGTLLLREDDKGGFDPGLRVTTWYGDELSRM